MRRASINFRRILSEELDTEKLHRNFLMTLLELQKVERGSIWVKIPTGYHCVEALGNQSEKVRGVTIPADRPSIVGWVIENGEMTVARPDEDERHYKDLEEQLDIKSTLILCFPLLLRDGTVYGAVQIIDTSAGGIRLNLNKTYLQTLQEIVDHEGYMALRRIEERVLLALNCSHHVIATGGSAVYSPAAMEHLKRRGIAVFLDVDLPTLEARIHDWDSRGLAKRPDQSFTDLFRERLPLYRKYADLTIDCRGRSQEEVCAEVIRELGAFRNFRNVDARKGRAGN